MTIKHSFKQPELIIVACAQIAPIVANVTHNRQVSNAAIARAADLGAQVVVLPELAQSGYVFNDKAEALSVAEDLDGPTVQGWRALAEARGIVVVAGICERLSSTEVANSAVMIEPDGRITAYRKAHLWNKETLIFTPGTEQPPVVDTVFGRIAVMICYDQELPEWVRLTAMQNTQLLCVPVNWPNLPRPETERPSEIVRAQANAAINHLFLAVCDRCGEERGVDWVGGSSIIDVDGYPVEGAISNPVEHVLTARLELSKADDKWISDYNHVLEDRRPALYSGLCASTRYVHPPSAHCSTTECNPRPRHHR